MRRLLIVFVVAGVVAVPAGFAAGQMAGGDEVAPTAEESASPGEPAEDAPRWVSEPSTWDACEEGLRNGVYNYPCIVILREFAPDQLPEELPPPPPGE